MNPINSLDLFAARLREHISGPLPSWKFNELALEQFSLQFDCNFAYRRFCKSRGISPTAVQCWNEIPAIPTVAFKEWDLSCLPAEDRSVVFHSSGTTQHRPSRHFHNRQSLAVYEASLLEAFSFHLLETRKHPSLNRQSEGVEMTALALTPSPAQAPHSSLVHMFETLRQHLRFRCFSFTGRVAADGSWSLQSDETIARLQQAARARQPVFLLGAAFSFVQLLDCMEDLRLQLPEGSRVMETGGYKGRSRAMPKSELHACIASRLGVRASHIVCEYGMSELSSQAYDRVVSFICEPDAEGLAPASRDEETGTFHFPPWVRVQVISAETGREVEEGQTGLIRVYDLANVYSVMAIQTEDLGVRRGNGFVVIGRAERAEARGCSLQAQ